MSKAPSGSRFFGLLRPQAQRASAVDPADMGTCFGLEMSLEPLTLPPPTRTAAKVQKKGWVQRLRRKGEST